MSTRPTATDWRDVCALQDIVPQAGVAARYGDAQIALFRVVAADGERVYAIDNHDPCSGANVLARGIVGTLDDEPVVASPVYKQHFSLTSGRCLEDEEKSVASYEARIEDGRVQVRLPLAASGGRPTRGNRPRLVVIGNGMAGMRTVEELLKFDPDLYDITVFGAEPHGNYNRILLSPVLAGEQQLEDIMLHPPAWYAERGITLHTGEPVVAVDRARRVVRAQSGREAPYERLLIATGSQPFIIPVPGVDLDGVVSFREIGDVNAMLAAAREHHRAVVIGGGLLGLEAANGLKRRGMDVTVVHLMERLMERQLDAPAAALLEKSLQARGIRVELGAQTEAILGDERVTGIRLKDGRELPAELVVMAVGIRPNIALAQHIGLRTNRGILVDDTLQSYDPRIYAVGECVQHRDATYGLVAPLWEQAKVCAAHLARQGRSRYAGSVTATQLKVSGVDLFSAGELSGGVDSEDLTYSDPDRGVYKRLVVRDGRLAGALMYGDVADGNWYFDLIRQGADIRAVRERLVFGQAVAKP